ncbi:carboxymuconolactone decarboxylase [Longimycelium tulufanense]|uniref:Carboxymuconolactone decarboxylase n=1 Tax=Longimycelium tulufanense TaxID=907463 RepID=A0A8J3CKU9_9PSEU|nr:carboxymuconolactone decarboxylase family protein [Longimycelium tulufanense]GGM84294.1 carboxymuconolactone decarboxylase [Longimycelium tulufanense]
MPHIELPTAAPGILGLLQYRPDTARPLRELAEVLLRGPSTLSRGERELIAAYVSSRNDCQFCTRSHAACAAVQLPEGPPLVEQVLIESAEAPLPPKLAALLRIAAAVQKSGNAVTPELVADARAGGATDLEIHDTVLISALFCMYNRYVDGLATRTPTHSAAYRQLANRIAVEGYLADF